VAIVGALMDDLVPDRPGTRYGPRAIRMAAHRLASTWPARWTRSANCASWTSGDAPVLPADPVRSHSAIEQTTSAVLAAGAMPVTLGGDHSISEATIRACAAVHGPVGLVHFDAHTDTAPECFGVEFSHETLMYRLVRDGRVDPQRYVQIGLRGYWPPPAVFDRIRNCRELAGAACFGVGGRIPSAPGLGLPPAAALESM
jgi:agmatinase